MTQISGLTVRQHARKDFDLAVEFVIADRHQEQVRFSPISTAKDQHAVRGRAQDISTGGLGWVCDHFLPRMCQGTIRIFDPRPVGQTPDGSPVYDVAFEHACIVRRVTMISHAPQYSIGMAFIDPEPDIEEHINRLRAMVDQQHSGSASTDTVEGGGGHE